MTKKQDNSSFVLMWGGTLAVALGIIAVCIFIAIKNRQPDAVSNPPQAQKILPAAQVSESAEYEDFNQIAADDPATKSQALQAPQASQPATLSDEPAAIVAAPGDGNETPAQLQLDQLAGTIELKIPFMDIRNKIPLDHTCFRQNSSPAIMWSAAPEATRSYVVWLERRDANTDPFTTWILFNIPAGTSALAGGMAKSEQLENDARHATADHGTIGYVGPCDSKGEHVYVMRVFALDKILDAPARASKDDLIRAMNGHIIDAAEQSFTHYYRL